jgi:hypothetical protein
MTKIRLLSAVLTAGCLALTALTPVHAATSKPASTPAKPASTPAKPATGKPAAGAPSNIGTFKTWTAWTGNDSSGLICYVSAEPSSSKPDGAHRDPIHFLVVHRKAQNTKNEVQTLIGYPIKKDSKPTAAIDGKNYSMIADGNGAWLANASDEAGFVAQLKKGKALTIKGTSQRGTDTTDTYTLSGISQALAAIDKACN